jgi:hypothetical protein
MDCGDTLSETVGGPLDSVSGAGVVVLLLPVLLLPPLPHALKRSVTPTSTTSNIEDFCRTMGPPRRVSIAKQYRPNDNQLY